MEQSQSQNSGYNWCEVLELFTLPALTFSPPASVRMKVEKLGTGWMAWADQHSMVAPIGRQNMGTDSGNGKLS